jgi:PTH1 family peptidyl-tRNA hydrolase
LKPFGSSERSEVELMQGQAIDAVEALVSQGLLEAQQRFHAPQ